MRWLAGLLLCIAAAGSLAAQRTTPATACPVANAEQPSGQTSRHIRQAIRRAGAGGVVVLSGNYQIEQTIDLPDGLTLCSNDGATLTWADPDHAGHILNATRAQNTVIRGLILEGRGIVVKGKGHRIEGNLIRNIRFDSERDSRWSERHGIFIQDIGDGLQIQQNVFTQIGDTSIMGFNVRNSLIAGNSFTDLNEGIHLFAVADTLIRDNTGTRIRAMSIEIQGEDQPGLRIENNRFRDWRPEPKGSLYAMSVVAGQGAVVQGNVVECAPGMLAALEVGGQAPQILNNTLVNADLVIALAYDAVIRGNSVKNASILKDVNRVKRGSLLIEGNTVEDPPRVGIFADEWGGYEQVTVRGNRIRKRITEETGEFLGMVTSPYRKQMSITDNVFKVENAGRKRAIRAVCIANYGYKGNLSGLQVTGNTCDGDGIATFGDSNSLGGHAGIIYRNNSLLNLKDTIVGHVDGLQATGNELRNVAADHANLRRP